MGRWLLIGSLSIGLLISASWHAPVFSTEFIRRTVETDPSCERPGAVMRETFNATRSGVPLGKGASADGTVGEISVRRVGREESPAVECEIPPPACIPISCSPLVVINEVGQAVFDCESDLPDEREPALPIFIDCDYDQLFDPEIDIRGISGTCHVPRDQGGELVITAHTLEARLTSRFSFCETTVTVTAACGDGIVQPVEECDGASDCAEDCQFIPPPPPPPPEPEPVSPPPPPPPAVPEDEPPAQVTPPEPLSMAVCPEGWREMVISSGPEAGKKIPLVEGTCPQFPNNLLGKAFSPTLKTFIELTNQFVQNPTNQDLLAQLNQASVHALEDYLQGAELPVFGITTTPDQKQAALVVPEELPDRALLAKSLLNAEGKIELSADGSLPVSSAESVFAGAALQLEVMTGLNQAAAPKYYAFPGLVWEVNGGGGCSLVPASPRVARPFWGRWFREVFHAVSLLFSR